MTRPPRILTLFHQLLRARRELRSVPHPRREDRAGRPERASRVVHASAPGDARADARPVGPSHRHGAFLSWAILLGLALASAPSAQVALRGARTPVPRTLPGEILWSAPLATSVATAAPTVAPDGTVYVHSGSLYAFRPDGALLWSASIGGAQAVGLADDGTVYAGSTSTIFAFDSSGTQLWSFTEPPGGQGLMAGPDVGPDGNVYAITDGGGLGALSLTPDGDLLWNVPGFINLSGTGLTHVQFGPDRLYFAEDIVPGCATQGLVAVGLDGSLPWCQPFSDVARPVASPSGNAYFRASDTLYAFDPGGALLWSFAFPFPNDGFIGPASGPDDSAYLFHDSLDLWAFDAGGGVRWTRTGVAGQNFPFLPAVAPDGRALVFGTVFSFGVNGDVVALDPEDGATLWSTPLEGPSEGAAGPAAFSPDGRVTYLTTYASTGTRLLAIQVRP